jgi:hypothetical protein
LTNLLNENFTGFINRIKLTTEKIVEDKIVKFYNGTFDIDELLFDENGQKYIDEAIKYLNKLKTPSNIVWCEKQINLLLLETDKKCFTIQSDKNSNHSVNCSQVNFITLIFYKSVILVEVTNIYNSYGNNTNNNRYYSLQNKLPLNSLWLIKKLLISGKRTDYNNSDLDTCYCKINMRQFFTEMEENPQYFVNNCVEFENLCNQEKQNYIEKISILENERKEIEVIKQECNEKMETYHKLQNEYDEFQIEKQKLEEEKRKIKLVKLKLEQMKCKLDEEREEFEKQKTELTETNINLDELLNL